MTRKGQPKRVWGPPTTLRAHLESLGETMTPGEGSFVFTVSPCRTWSTERLEEYVQELHALIADGADPALLAPHINSANAMLEEGVIARFVRRITTRAKLAFWNASTPHPRSVNGCFTP